jgi:hypothetical protein
MIADAPYVSNFPEQGAAQSHTVIHSDRDARGV